MKLVAFVVLLSAAAALAQDYQDYEVAPRAAPVRLRPGNGPIDSRPAPTPVPILKQINRHNEDGSYTYGYEGADGSFKIETKLATGEVKGKYGYVDETGKVRVVEYGANKYGFQPSGEGITVAPPTLVDETTNKDRLLPEYDDEPQRPYIARVQQRPQSRPPPPPPRPSPRPQPQYDDYDEPAPPQRPQYSSGPSPPRIQVPGAQPSGDVTYSPQPRPARPDPEYSQNTGFSLGPPQHSNVRVSRPVSLASLSQGPVRPVSEPSYQPSYQAPRPAPQPAPQYAAPSHQQGRSTSVLDQLAKDYALPQSGAQPLHDISFGYY